MPHNEIPQPKGNIMTQPTPVVTDVTETPAAEQEPRFDLRKTLKIAAITTAVVGTGLVLKRKLNSSVDGQVNVTVETDKSDES